MTSSGPHLVRRLNWLLQFHPLRPIFMGGSCHLWGATGPLTSVASKTRLVGFSNLGGLALVRHGGLGFFGIEYNVSV